jgi:aminoacrylate peracid reductase
MPYRLAATVFFCAASSLMVIQMPAKQIVTTGPSTAGPFSAAVKAGGFIYLSGTLAVDDRGALAGAGDVTAQTRRVIEKLQTVLTASGSSLDRVLAVTVYLKSPADFQAMNDAYKMYWPKDPPTRTTVIADLVLPGALVEMSMIAAPAGAERTVVHPSAWLRSPNPYSYAIKSGDTLFLSGIISRNGRDNTSVAGDVTTQTDVVLKNAGELLAAAGMTYSNVVSARVFVTQPEAFQPMNAAYRKYFPTAPPARATVVAGLTASQYLVEMTMIASSAPREAINDGAPNPNLSTAIRAGHHVYLSGALGVTADNHGDIASQTRAVLEGLRATLSAAGCTPADVVDAVVYLGKTEGFSSMDDEYRRFFGREFPARSTVKAGLLVPDGAIEIMMTAVTR